MEKKAKRFFTVLVVPHNQKKILNFKIPRWLNNSLITIFVIFILGAAIFVKYHKDLKKEAVNLRAKEELYRSQTEKIMYFSTEVENLRKEVLELRKLDTNVKGLSKKLKQSALPTAPNPITSSSKAQKLGQGGPDKNAGEALPLTSEKLDQDISALKKEISSHRNILEDIHKYLQVQLSFIRITPNRWPLRGWVTSRFGWRNFRGVREFHEGIDIANFYGASIRSAADGIVEFSGWRGGYGNLVIINHGRGISTYYGHNSSNLVRTEQFVKKGSIIARVGNTGRTTGYHLHYEVRVNDKPANPFRYLY